MSIDGISSLADTSKNTVASNNVSSLQGSLKNISSESSDEELLQVCKDFESYFVEEILKEVKEAMIEEDKEEDSSLSTLTDYHMDGVIELVADELVDEVGTNFTQQLFEQMKRNYNIE
ncbi:MAG: hypothetical protein PUA75_09780 [Clostridiales bacterium]|nr:hypothetical protein [Clostridiales bacterium]